MFTIRLRYCGGCNPQINRSKVIRDLKENLERRGIKVDFTTDKERAVHIVLLISGCMHACLVEKYLRCGYNPMLISVKGEMVDDRYIEEESIPDFLIKKIIDLFNSFHNGIPF